MRIAIVVAGACVSVATASHGQDGQSLGAHVHGVGELGVAADSSILAIALRAPGMDIVGFEYAPLTDEDRAAVDRAMALLQDPIALFAPTEAAGCRVTSVETVLAFDGGGHEGHDHGVRDDRRADAGDATGGHSEFAATYLFDCADPDALESVDASGYFATFAGAVELEAVYVSYGGQNAGALDADAPIFLF